MTMVANTLMPLLDETLIWSVTNEISYFLVPLFESGAGFHRRDSHPLVMAD
jgi:hypothetical protein